MSAPKWVSIREFAKLDGCDDKLVRRALGQGKLTANGEGKLDASLAGSEWRKRNRRGGGGADIAKVSAPKVRAGKKSAPSADELSDALDSIDDAAVGDFLAEILAGRFSTLTRAEQIKENGLAAKHLIAARKEAGQLIEVERAQTILFEVARAARNAWLAFPTKVGPLIAADLDVDADRVVEALTVHVQEQLEQLGEPNADFTADQQ